MALPQGAPHLTSAPVRRLALPLALVLVAAAAGGMALRADAEPSPAAPPPAAATTMELATPVLSARRVPEFLVSPIADRRLEVALFEFLLSVPPSTCLVVGRTGGAHLVEHQPDLALIPASTLKLLTARAVLDVLGQDTTLSTRAVAAAPPEAGVVAGDLWLVGGGDPLLATAGYAAHFEHQPWPRSALEDLADRVAGSVHRIDGRVLGDDSRYDAVRTVPTWPERYLTGDAVGPLSALTVDDGYDTYVPDEEPAADPAASAARILTELLEARGVTVAGPPASGRAPAEATEVATLPSLPLTDVVAHMLRESDNGSAELLTKELGREVGGAGTTAAGVAVVRDVAADAGIPLDGAAVVDGSGLDRGNRLSCRTLMAQLDAEGPDSPITRALPVAGSDGTLTERFQGSPAAGILRAKTGTLLGVTGFAGFVATPAGGRLTFAFLSNGEFDQDYGFALQEQLGAVLARYPEGPSLVEVGPLAPT